MPISSSILSSKASTSRRPKTPKGKWFNYGGDKIWPMPEGDKDADHWPGPIADQLDDGTYVLTAIYDREESSGADPGSRTHGTLVPFASKGLRTSAPAFNIGARS